MEALYPEYRYIDSKRKQREETATKAKTAYTLVALVGETRMVTKFIRGEHTFERKEQAREVFEVIGKRGSTASDGW